MKKTLLTAALATAFAFPAFAHDDPEDAAPPGKHELFSFKLGLDGLLADAADARHAVEMAREQAESAREWAHDLAANLHESMAFMFSDRVGRGKVVKGAPYSADVITETNQPLADGNAITHKAASRVYRDGEGRTRQETLRDNEVRSVYISDPVEGSNYTLIPGSKIAVKIPRIEIRHEMRLGREKERDKERDKDREKMSGAAKDASIERRVVVRTTDGQDDGPGSHEEVRVQVVRIGDGPPPVPPIPPEPPVPPKGAHPAIAPIPPIPRIPGMNTMRFESTAHLGKGTTTSLGTKTFDGVKAEGTSTVWTIPAGKIGNRNPINVTSETWYSPDLQVTVSSRYNDPRTGESTYRLAAIKRAEPAAELFKVPEGYKTRGRGARRERDSEEKR